MTRITEYSIFATPCCGALFSRPPFYPIHDSTHNRWTDGYSENVLLSDDDDLSKCKCGAWFLLSKSKPVGIISKQIEYRESTWDLKLEAWLRKKKNETTQEAMERLFRVKPKNIVQTPPIQIPPCAKHLDDNELLGVIESSSSNIDLLIVARRRHWRNLNNSYRARCRTINLKNLNAYPAYEPSAAQKENMRCLISLLEVVGTFNRIEIAELYRELGEFEKSLCALESVKNQTEAAVLLQRNLIEECHSGPVSII